FSAFSAVGRLAAVGVRRYRACCRLPAGTPDGVDDGNGPPGATGIVHRLAEHLFAAGNRSSGVGGRGALPTQRLYCRHHAVRFHDGAGGAFADHPHCRTGAGGRERLAGEGPASELPAQGGLPALNFERAGIVAFPPRSLPYRRRGEILGRSSETVEGHKVDFGNPGSAAGWILLRIRALVPHWHYHHSPVSFPRSE